MLGPRAREEREGPAGKGGDPPAQLHCGAGLLLIMESWARASALLGPGVGPLVANRLMTLVACEAGRGLMGLDL